MSFLKKDWQLSDYPVAITFHEPDQLFSPPRFTQHSYRACIVNQALSGSGDTPEDAMMNLKQNFERARNDRQEEGQSLPRPGKRAKIEFASQEKIAKCDALSRDFVQRIFDIEAAWVSDESCLWDFHMDQTNDFYYTKIYETYHVDVSNIESANLWAIFERIENTGTSAQQ